MTGLQGWSVPAVQLGTETDLCTDFYERENSPPLTKEKISVPDLSLVFVMVSLKWPLQTAKRTSAAFLSMCTVSF